MAYDLLIRNARVGTGTGIVSGLDIGISGGTIVDDQAGPRG